jgi:hypothetical protein
MSAIAGNASQATATTTDDVSFLGKLEEITFIYILPEGFKVLSDVPKTPFGPAE